MSDTIDLKVGAPAHGGHCVARHDGRVIFVRHALPGEKVRARLTESGTDARFWRADAVDILEPSPDRVQPAWAQAGAGGVGGGELSHVALPAQRTWKQAVLVEAFERFATLEFPGTVAAAPGDDEQGGLGYRTRVTATATKDGRAGMFAHRSKDVFELESMPLAVAEVEHALLAGKFPAGARIGVVAPSEGDVRITVNGLPWRGGKVDKRDNAPRMVRESVCVGESTWNFRVDVDGFWQVHREAPAVLVAEVLDRVGNAGRVADLYSGAGLLTAPLAEGGREVLAVESDGTAGRAARRNAHNLPTVTTVQGDVREVLHQGIGSIDAVVLDPPRSGAGAKTIDALAGAAPQRVVYVACDPVALARDTALLDARGYGLVDAQAHDLFPHTHHVETVATFERR